jgi:hypothetical protein
VRGLRISWLMVGIGLNPPNYGNDKTHGHAEGARSAQETNEWRLRCVAGIGESEAGTAKQTKERLSPSELK